jgi:glyoxylase-like metal-dependent hydrolase (beta-lactamase superfamily II)
MVEITNRLDSTSDWTDQGIFEVIPGVYRIPLPLIGDALRAVNIYALMDGERLTLIDSGYGRNSLTRETLEKALAQIGRSVADIDQFLITHAHSDHYTFAVEVRRELSTLIRLGAGEKPNMREAARLEHPQPSPLGKRLIIAGASELQERVADSHKQQNPWEMPDLWMHDGEKIQVGETTLDVIATPGHTQGHVVFVDKQRSVIFSGDHVLPHITPSIGYEPAPTQSPLADYLLSLMIIRGMPDAQMLPAHGAPGQSIHKRVDELLAHHEYRLEQTLDVVRRADCSALKAAEQLRWTRREHHFNTLDLLNQMLAVNETMAHLDVLASRGNITRLLISGVAHYTAEPTRFRITSTEKSGDGNV